jgi:hypothetical protein
VSYNKSGCGDVQPSRIAIRGSRLSPRDDKRIHLGLIANGTCGDNHQPHDDRPPNRQSADLDLNTLRAELATYPCCATNSNSTREGDLVNLVVVEGQRDPIVPFIARGWHLTQKLNFASMIATVRAFIFRGEYLTELRRASP